MKRLLALVLLAGLAFAQEEEAPAEAAPKLPGALRAGAADTFDQAAIGERLAGTTTFRVLRGDDEGTLLVVREYDSGDRGPLTWRDRLTAEISAADGRVHSFSYELANAEGDYQLLSRAGPDPKREGRILHERFEYRAKGEPKVTKYRTKPEGRWAPDVLEPFLVPALELGTDGASGEKLTLMDPVKGRLSRQRVSYALLGEGEMNVGAGVKTYILLRRRGDEAQSVFYRAEDWMVIKHESAGIALKQTDDGEAEAEEED